MEFFTVVVNIMLVYNYDILTVHAHTHAGHKGSAATTFMVTLKPLLLTS